MYGFAGRSDCPAGVAGPRLADELNAIGVKMQVVEARSSVRDRLRAEGLDEKLGGIDRFRSVAQAVENFEQRAAA